MAEPRWVDEEASQVGLTLLSIAYAVRRYKSQSGLSLGAEIPRLHIAVDDPAVGQALNDAREDIASITRATVITIGARPDPTLQTVMAERAFTLGFLPAE